MSEKRGPQRRTAAPRLAEPPDSAERPPIPWDKLILREPDAAKFVKLSPSTFRKKAAAGEFERHPLTEGTWGYYVYDLLDWFLAQQARQTG